MSEVILPGFETTVQVTANNCFSLPRTEEETVWIFNVIDTGVSEKSCFLPFVFKLHSWRKGVEMPSPGKHLLGLL